MVGFTVVASSITTNRARMLRSAPFLAFTEVVFVFVYVGMAEEIPSTSLSWRPSRHTAKMARIIIDSCVRQDTESEEDSFIECDKEFNSLQPSDRNSSSESEEDATPPLPKDVHKRD